MSKDIDSEFADKVAEVCLNCYNELPKKGKPVVGKEWTLLSAVVASLDGQLTVVSLATGTKCLGGSQLSPRGDLVNDSHAEVLARRCFIKYLYDQISKFKHTGHSDIIVNWDHNEKYEINSKVKFHFYTSHVPCGDASIIPKRGEKRKCESIDNNVKRQAITHIELEFQLTTGTVGVTLPKRNINASSKEVIENEDKVISNVNPEDDFLRASTEQEDSGRICDGDIYRTGAKCVEREDLRLPGALYHVTGVVRTKPGRGDPTLSVSCSDKLARWLTTGLQGALLSLLLVKPVFLETVVVGAGGPYCPDVMYRALLSRCDTPHKPRLLHSSVVFPHSRYCAGPLARPCPSAILWTPVSNKPLEVSVEGRRQGVTKKCADQGRLSVCKLELFRLFVSLTGDRYKEKSYKDAKSSAEEYNTRWAQTRSQLGVWTTKPPGMGDFTVT